MAKKIYIKDNYFYMEDTVTGELTEDHVKNIMMKRKNINDDEIIIKGGPEWDQRQALRREELQKVDGSAFADMDELTAFFEVNTGFNAAPGGSGAGILPEGYEMVSGILRFSGGVWTFLDDAGHTPVGVSSVTTVGTAPNTAIQITFDKTYSEVLSGGANGDGEYLKRGVRFAESSMGLNTMNIISTCDSLNEKLTWNSTSNTTEVSGFGTLPQSYIATWDNAKSEIDITGDPNTFVNIYSFAPPTFKDERLFATVRTTSSNRVVYQVRRRDTGALIGDPEVFFGSAANAVTNFVTYININKPARLDVEDANLMDFSLSNIDFYYIAKI